MNTIRLLLFFALTCIVLPASADSGKARNFLAPTNGSTAVGRVEAQFSKNKSSLKFSFSRLTPGMHELYIDGVLRATVVPSTRGVASASWDMPAKSGRPVLDFDPRGKTAELRNNSVAVLSGVISGPGESSGSQATEGRELRNLTSNARAKASTSFSANSTGVLRWTVSLSGIPDVSTSLLLDGISVATATPVRGRLVFRFSSNNSRGTLPLPRDPRGGLIDITQGANALFQGSVNSRALGPDLAKKTEYFLFLPNTGLVTDASARVEYKVRESGRRDLEVELEDVPVGDYSFLVNGVNLATIQVVNTVDGTEGELEFSSADDDALLLNFNPEGTQMSIVQGASTFFSGVFTPTLLNRKPGNERESVQEEYLTRVAAPATSDAKAEYEVDSSSIHEFNVEIEDVPRGAYTLHVGGIRRATINVVTIAGSTEGEVEFRTVREAGKIPLSFDPRGQLIEIFSPSGSVFFSHLFGSGSASGSSNDNDDDGEGTTSVGSHFRLPLLPAANVAGSAIMTFDSDSPTDADFEIKIRNHPTGSYSVKVDGVTVGNLLVVVDDDETEGEIDFDTSPDSGDLLLNFPVHGKLIEITDGANVLFSRTAPL